MRPTPTRTRTLTALLTALGLTAAAWAQAPAPTAPAAKQETKTKAKAKVKAKEAAPAAKVDLNKATAEELEALPGIGTVHAKAIIAARPFKAVADLKAVKGITAKTYDGLADRVTVAAPPAVKGAATKKAMTKPAAEKAATVEKAAVPKPAAPLTKAAAAKTATKGETVKKGAETAKAVKGPDHPININKASLDELRELSGIGPVHAQAIIDGRPYATIDDVMKVKGIKEGIFAKIKDHITVK